MKVMGRRCFIGVSPLSATNRVHAIESIEETGLRRENDGAMDEEREGRVL